LTIAQCSLWKERVVPKHKEFYWLRHGEEAWRKVTQDEFVEAEGEAGFYPKDGCGPVATGGFSSGGVSGAITYNGKPPDF
jgi:hypothetical protein